MQVISAQKQEGKRMDNCRMNDSASRSCRVLPRDYRFQASRQKRAIQNNNSCSDKIEDTGIYTHADHLPLAMAYVPFQKFSNTFNPCKALHMGTIFPELCKPFCGKRGACR